MFKTALGVSVPFPKRIKEEFEMAETSILFNLSFEKLEPFIYEFIEQLSEPLFFVLEIPMSEQKEREMRKDDSSPFHKEVCYLDGQSKEQIKSIFDLYGALLLNDGISQFAIYSHVTNDGIYIMKYKVVRIYSQKPSSYLELFKKYGLSQTENLITVWDTFSQETPGQVERIETDGKDIYDVYDELLKKGMYVAKVAED